jgi:hypothetical protein
VENWGYIVIAETSVIAYKEHKAAGKVGSQAMTIFDAMGFSKDYSRRELVALTGLELSSICGRVNEMLQIGMLKEVNHRKCKVTGKTVKPVVKLSLF